jgi:hypothetical protein
MLSIFTTGESLPYSKSMKFKHNIEVMSVKLHATIITNTIFIIYHKGKVGPVLN